jgi:alkanesulfonate monooxygenase
MSASQLNERAGLKIYTTGPVAAQAPAGCALQRVRDAARWSEDAGCEGMLVFADNRQLDPWLVAQAAIEWTRSLVPLVAVQPVYTHPYTVAKMASSLANLYGRRVDLNMVAGGFKNDLAALGDETPHDERYARLIEYTTIIRRLFDEDSAVTFAGRYYTVSNLKLTPRLPPELRPEILVSGSSPAGVEAARSLGATAVEYPEPPEAYSAPRDVIGKGLGLRIGVIARREDEEAWSVANARYPEDRKGQLTRELATKVSDSQWHRQLSRTAADVRDPSPYWLVPFENYRAMSPYLVGSYERVAEQVRRYIELGYSTFILDEPASAEEMHHVERAFEHAVAGGALS